MSQIKKVPTTLLSAGLLMMVVPSAFAQDSVEETSVSQVAGQAAMNIEEVLVQARRRDERLQDVPITVQALSGNDLVELNMFDFSDLGKLTSGVSLEREGGITTIRGVSFNPTAQTNSSAAFYINEGPVQTAVANQSMFDIEQYEILKGPQGTLRGQSAPTGAITVRTRRPDMQEFGGTFISTITDADGHTVQGALNLPVVEDVLALRLAGITSRNDNGGVRSVNSSADPFAETKAFRLSAQWQPMDNLTAAVMYQKLKVDSLSLGSAVLGEGAPGGSYQNASYALPVTVRPGHNGPVIERGSRRTIREYADRSSAEQEFASAQIDYSFAGQSLSYVGARSTNESNPGRSFADVGNLVTGDWPGRSLESDLTRWTHELRLSNEKKLFGFMDYTVGVFYLDEEIKNIANNGISFQTGAFGSPLGAPLPFSPNLDYSTTSFAHTQNKLEELSYFGNLTFHLTDDTELAVGARIINAEKDALRINSQTEGMSAQLLAEETCVSQGGIFGRTYSGVCDIPVAGRVTGTIPDQWDKSPNVYSASLSHRFTPSFMVYVSYGESWRPGPTQGNLMNGANDPVLESLVALEDEETQSIEVGFKTSWLDDRLTVNIAYYKQEYDNFVLSQLSGIPYLADTGVGPRYVTLAIPMNSNVDVDVEGVDLDFSFTPFERWNISGGVSWADATFDNELIPCWDGDFDGVQDQNPMAFNPAAYDAAGVKIARCTMSGRGSQTPKWDASLRTSYSHPVSDRLDAFVRGVITYTPKNRYANPVFTYSGYTMVDLTLGVRDAAAGWELQLFVKNLTDQEKIVSIGNTDVMQGNAAANLFGPAGYTSVSYLRPREFGLTFRYAFGAH